ncbi:hypothetical protein [Chryseobacterium sp.]|jgi:hypothetical protein|uniref:hypothetical protein n=1 Tax=Chryseobacterium sp. TaxID=1871047 RepID=UPI00289F8E88|nr:hypothetical protein [Chryseobacterium sp.]
MADESKSIFIAHANITLWGGTLEGIIDNSQKFYSLKTLKPIELSKVQIGETKIGDEVAKAQLGLEDLTVDFMVEYQGDSAAQGSPKKNDNYTKMVFAVTSKEKTEQALKKGGLLGNDFTINSVKVGYLSYGSEQEKQKEEFVTWMSDNVKKLEK